MAVAGSTDRELRQVQSGLERAALGGLWERTLRWAADGGARALALRQSGTTKRTSPERVERGRDAQPTRGGGLQALLGFGVSSSRPVLVWLPPQTLHKPRVSCPAPHRSRSRPVTRPGCRFVGAAVWAYSESRLTQCAFASALARPRGATPYLI